MNDCHSDVSPVNNSDSDLSVTKHLMSFRDCNWQNEMRRKQFVSEKGLIFEIHLE